jgi:hypothetical protein
LKGEAYLNSSPFKGEVGRGMGRNARYPIPSPALPLKGRENETRPPLEGEGG